MELSEQLREVLRDQMRIDNSIDSITSGQAYAASCLIESMPRHLRLLSRAIDKIASQERSHESVYGLIEDISMLSNICDELTGRWNVSDNDSSTVVTNTEEQDEFPKCIWKFVSYGNNELKFEIRSNIEPPKKDSETFLNIWEKCKQKAQVEVDEYAKSHRIVLKEPCFCTNSYETLEPSTNCVTFVKFDTSKWILPVIDAFIFADEKQNTELFHRLEDHYKQTASQSVKKKVSSDLPHA